MMQHRICRPAEAASCKLAFDFLFTGLDLLWKNPVLRGLKGPAQLVVVEAAIVVLLEMEPSVRSGEAKEHGQGVIEQIGGIVAAHQSEQTVFLLIEEFRGENSGCALAIERRF